jgi:hypothetical protein
VKDFELEYNWSQLLLLQPQNLDGIGPCTRVVLVGGENLIKRTARSVARSLCRRAALDPTAIRGYYERETQFSNLAPFPLGVGLTLQPLRMLTDGNGQGVYGYVAVERVRSVVVAAENRTMLLLANGQSVLCHSSPQTVSQRLQAAEYIAARYWRKFGSGAPSRV